MDEERPGYWERLERKRRNVKLAVIGTLFLLGGVTGFLVGKAEGSGEFFGQEPIFSPALAIGLALVFLTAVGIGTWLTQRNSDEVERLLNFKAAAVGGSALMIVYPVWFLLWRGGLVPEPMHAALILLFLASMFGALIFYRSRSPR